MARPAQGDSETGKRTGQVPRREPRPGHGFGRRLSGVPKSLGGLGLGGVGGTPEGCINVTPFIDALQANDPFNRSPPVALPCCAPRASHRRTSDIRPSSAVEPLLKAREAVGRQIADLDRKVMRLARNVAKVRQFMTAPGIG